MWLSVITGCAASFAIIVGIAGLLRWFIRIEVRGLRGEFHPNGGSSFRDHVDERLDSQDIRLDRIDRRVGHLERRTNRWWKW